MRGISMVEKIIIDGKESTSAALDKLQLVLSKLSIGGNDTERKKANRLIEIYKPFNKKRMRWDDINGLRAAINRIGSKYEIVIINKKK